MTIENAETVADRLPVDGSLALAMAGFITLMTEVMPAGLLPQISAGLKIDESMAGQLVTAYAAGSVVTAIPMMTLTQAMPRRMLLLLAVGGFALLNMATALKETAGLHGEQVLTAALPPSGFWSIARRGFRDTPTRYRQ